MLFFAFGDEAGNKVPVISIYDSSAALFIQGFVDFLE